MGVATPADLGLTSSLAGALTSGYSSSSGVATLPRPAQLCRTPTTTWRVRPFAEQDMLSVLGLQADAFHEPGPLRLLDSMTYSFFKAEVLDALKKKMRCMTQEQYIILVAESPDGVVGVVEVALADEQSVTRHLPPGCPSYAYISSMAVHPSFRRQGIAAGMLSAAEQQARVWGQEHVALHVYKDNDAARELYTRRGFQQIAQDPDWKGVLGGKVRLLMHKHSRRNSGSGQ